MRGYFDDDEKAKAERRRDTELTLGAGALFGLFFGLVLLCGLCFGAGYAVGHHGSTSGMAATVPTAAPDQEPLEGNNAVPKPSASEQSPAPAPQTDSSSSTPGDGAGTNPNSSESGAAASGQGNGPTGGQNGAGQGAGGPGATAPGAVRPALPAGGNTAPPAQGGTPNVRPALPGQTQFMVQIAAVLNPEDANVLVAALRRHGYTVTETREPADGLIHVRIGPFTTRDEATRWANKLLGDGYNAIVQP